MARGYAEPWEALPKKAGGLFTELASSVATHPDSNCTHAHRCAHVRAHTQNMPRTRRNRMYVNTHAHAGRHVHIRKQTQ